MLRCGKKLCYALQCFQIAFYDNIFLSYQMPGIPVYCAFENYEESI